MLYELYMTYNKVYLFGESICRVNIVSLLQLSPYCSFISYSDVVCLLVDLPEKLNALSTIVQCSWQAKAAFPNLMVHEIFH